MAALLIGFNPGYAQDPGAKAKIESALDQQTSVLYIQQPLTTVMADIAKKHAIPIKIDRRVAEAHPDSPGLPVSIDLKGVTLRSMLRLLLRTHRLEYINEGTRLLITTEEYADAVHRKRSFSLPAAVASDSVALTNAIRALILTNDFKGKANVQGNELAAEAPRNELGLIESLVDQLENAGDAQAIGIEDQSLFSKELQHPANMKFFLTPLDEAVRHLALTHSLPLVIDRQSLEAKGLSPSLRVTFELQGIELRRALYFLLHKYDLSYVVKNEVVMITTKRKVESQREIAIHTFPLVLAPKMEKVREMFLKRAPDVWAQHGGANEVVVFKNHFIVYGTRDVQLATRQYVDYVSKRVK